MVATPHGLLAAAVARRAHSEPEAFLLGLTSHLAADRMPHRDYRPRGAGGRLILCADLACMLLLLKRTQTGRREWVAIVGGLLPDVLEQGLGGHDVFSRVVHRRCHTDTKPSPLLNAGTQLLVAGIAYQLLRRTAFRPNRPTSSMRQEPDFSEMSDALSRHDRNGASCLRRPSTSTTDR